MLADNIQVVVVRVRFDISELVILADSVLVAGNFYDLVVLVGLPAD